MLLEVEYWRWDIGGVLEVERIASKGERVVGMLYLVLGLAGIAIDY